MIGLFYNLVGEFLGVVKFIIGRVVCYVCCFLVEKVGNYIKFLRDVLFYKSRFFEIVGKFLLFIFLFVFFGCFDFVVIGVDCLVFIMFIYILF